MRAHHQHRQGSDFGPTDNPSRNRGFDAPHGGGHDRPGGHVHREGDFSDRDGHPHRGPGRSGGRGRGHRGFGRANRGEVRTAVLLLLTEEAMHGYQLMQTISERTGGRWSPSPGAIYPVLNQLEDEGLITINAEAGRPGLIPGSMGTASYVVAGLGDPVALNSSPHGAGRAYSRAAARRTFSVDELRAAMTGIEYRDTAAFVDEIPQAYKDIDQVMADAADLVRVRHTLRQIVNVKGD